MLLLLLLILPLIKIIRQLLKIISSTTTMATATTEPASWRRETTSSSVLYLLHITSLEVSTFGILRAVLPLAFCSFVNRAILIAIAFYGLLLSFASVVSSSKTASPSASLSKLSSTTTSFIACMFVWVRSIFLLLLLIF